MTATFFISYRLRDSKSYERLYGAIKQKARFAQCLHPFDNAWLINSDESVEALSNALSKAVDADDSLLVVQITAPQSTARFDGQNLGEADRILRIRRDYKPWVDLSSECRKKLFIVSCDQDERTTERIFGMLVRRSEQCALATTSTWVLRSTMDLVNDLYREVLCLIGDQGKAFVAQLTNGFGAAPFGFLLGAVSPSDGRDLAAMQRQATTLSAFG